MNPQSRVMQPSLVSIVALSLASAAVAGPTWDVDYTEDAGQTALSAQIITVNSPIINIFGRLSGFGLTGTDLVDMYQFNVLAPTMFTLSTAGGALGGEANFDTQLFLFRRKGGNGNNTRAIALKANDNAASGVLGSRIGEGGPDSNVVLLTPGVYYVAITGSGMDAVSELGNSIWDTFGNPGETVNGLERELGDWSGTGAVGEYTIRLQALQGFVPAPGAIAALGLAAIAPRRRRTAR